MAIQKQKIKNIGKNVKSLRKQHSLTQENLSEKVNVTREHIAKIEMGIKTPSLNLLFKIAEILEVEPADLFEEKEDQI